jgi:hypothetical protein
VKARKTGGEPPQSRNGKCQKPMSLLPCDMCLLFRGLVPTLALRDSHLVSVHLHPSHLLFSSPATKHARECLLTNHVLHDAAESPYLSPHHLPSIYYLGSTDEPKGWALEGRRDERRQPETSLNPDSRYRGLGPNECCAFVCLVSFGFPCGHDAIPRGHRTGIGTLVWLLLMPRKLGRTESETIEADRRAREHDDRGRGLDQCLEFGRTLYP